jgi:hypothetical protein
MLLPEKEDPWRQVWFYPALLSFLNFRGRKPFESAFLFFTKLSGAAATCDIDEVVVLL